MVQPTSAIIILRFLAASPVPFVVYCCFRHYVASILEFLAVSPVPFVAYCCFKRYVAFIFRSLAMSPIPFMAYPTVTVLRPHYISVIPSFYAVLDYDRCLLFLYGLLFLDHRFLFRLNNFSFTVLWSILLPFVLPDGYEIAQEYDGTYCHESRAQPFWDTKSSHFHLVS